MTIAAHAQLLKELKFNDNFMELFSINRAPKRIDENSRELQLYLNIHYIYMVLNNMPPKNLNARKINNRNVLSGIFFVWDAIISVQHSR